ncbi:MAG: A/G-specific adenine glycosylase [Epsilonproteobacteria bacterium]|nr:A/G-specific adenine glycosylase [Campylobacterota bacterium]NPA64279.1 A/G-specific adenine glycosylase [Campylobacterota bacterium]
MEKAHLSLLEWFAKEGRHDLPWRTTTDPYRIYLSEVMLQQTQVERVVGYYERFLKRFPTLSSLAHADLDEVLALWSGLGYYKRARNLHATARICGLKLPKEYHALRKLPGIGEYTASAICSFAYHQPIAVVDTNISRVLGRLFATHTPKKVAQEFLNTSHPKKHNLALMDLGALVCKPSDPKCDRCPLHAFCQGKEDPASYTKRSSQKRQKKELHLALWIEDGQIALRRSGQRLYQGLLSLPPADPAPNPIASFRHSYTKYDITIYLHRQRPQSPIEWIRLDQLHQAPINAIVRKALTLPKLSISFANLP